MFKEPFVRLTVSESPSVPIAGGSPTSPAGVSMLSGNAGGACAKQALTAIRRKIVRIIRFHARTSARTQVKTPSTAVYRIGLIRGTRAATRRESCDGNEISLSRQITTDAYVSIGNRFEDTIVREVPCQYKFGNHVIKLRARRALSVRWLTEAGLTGAFLFVCLWN